MNNHLNWNDLTAYQAGKIESLVQNRAVEAHLQACYPCRVQAAASLPIRNGMVAPVLRGAHLDEQELAAYGSGIPIARTITQHLALCGACRHEAELLRQFVREMKLAG